jgi:hypothetical protein
MHVFRNGRQSLKGEFLLSGLRTALEKLESPSDSSPAIAALIWAGELECALADHQPAFLEQAERLTDALSDAVLGHVRKPLNELLDKVAQIHFNEQVSISRPEGFAYYALHPLDFADLARRFTRSGKAAAVIGIRSIGTTLSAIVAATLRESGMQVERTTVRPTGHPYDRQVELDDRQQRWLTRMRRINALFIIVDEGPGISGSSFLGTGEALVGHGVPHSQITFFCSRPIDTSKLVGPNAAERYSRFSYHNSQHDSRLNGQGGTFIGNGMWREKFLSTEASWPGSWTAMERSKFLAHDGRRLFKFHGYGRFGEEVRARLNAVAQAGFGPEYLGFEQGFGCTILVPGRPANRADLSPELLNRMAEYCAFRAAHITADQASTDELKNSVEANWESEFGSGIEPGLQLDVVRPVIADGKMQPHEWIISGGNALKVDSETHGDDHFFPGPTDIAWDLAGAIIEWEMNAKQARNLLRYYQQLTGDDVTGRMPSYLLSYATFRFAYCKMGAQAMAGTPDEHLLARDYKLYRKSALKLASRDRAQAA